VSGDYTEVLVFMVSVSHSYLKKIVAVPRLGIGGDDFEIDIREQNDFTTAELEDSILSVYELPLTVDEQALHKTNATLGDISFVTEKVSETDKYKVYAQVKINHVAPVTTDYKIGLRLDFGRQWV